MSINTAKVVCTGCDYQTSEVYRPILIKYQTDAGTTLEVSRTKGWCYCCDGYSDIEHLNYAEFQQQLADEQKEWGVTQVELEQLSNRLFAKVWHRSAIRQRGEKIESLAESIRSLGLLIDIAAARGDKARCLKCWSDKTVPISFNTETADSNNFTHQCGGRLTLIHSWDSPRFHFRVTTFILNAEGELISKELQ